MTRRPTADECARFIIRVADVGWGAAFDGAPTHIRRWAWRLPELWWFVAVYVGDKAIQGATTAWSAWRGGTAAAPAREQQRPTDGPPAAR